MKELQKYEDIVPPHTTRSKAVTLPFDSNKKYYFIEFETETTCTGKLAEFCQLSAVSENGIEEFSTFILPKGNISFGAYLVNGFSIKNIKGSRTLCKANIPVRSVSTEEAFCDFLTFLKRVKTSQNSDCVVVLIGHNAASFDVPILLRNSEMRFKDNLSQMNVHFADSQHLMKSLIKNKHKGLALESGGFCKPNQGSLYTHLFQEQFDAHDALEDVRALRRIIFASPLNLSRKSIVENSSVTRVLHALFDASHDNGPIKRSMAQNIAGSGLSYDDLCKHYSTFGKRGIVAILSNPPSTSSSKTPRVTRTKRMKMATEKTPGDKVALDRSMGFLWESELSGSLI